MEKEGINKRFDTSDVEAEAEGREKLATLSDKEMDDVLGDLEKPEELSDEDLEEVKEDEQAA